MNISNRMGQIGAAFPGGIGKGLQPMGGSSGIGRLLRPPPQPQRPMPRPAAPGMGMLPPAPPPPAPPPGMGAPPGQANPQQPPEPAPDSNILMSVLQGMMQPRPMPAVPGAGIGAPVGKIGGDMNPSPMPAVPGAGLGGGDFASGLVGALERANKGGVAGTPMPISAVGGPVGGGGMEANPQLPEDGPVLKPGGGGDDERMKAMVDMLRTQGGAGRPRPMGIGGLR